MGQSSSSSLTSPASSCPPCSSCPSCPSCPSSSSPAPLEEASQQTPSKKASPAVVESPISPTTNTNTNPSSSAPPSQSPQSMQSTFSEFERNILNYTNKARQRNGLPPLVWDKALAEKAKRWGEYLKQNEQCQIRHPTNTLEERNTYVPNGTGQNLYVGHGFPTNPADAFSAVRNWYDECKDYVPPSEGQDIPNNFADPNKPVGHFTQLLWKNTNRMGCAYIDCPKDIKHNNTIVNTKGAIIACNYDKGNVGGQFNENVPGQAFCQVPNEWIKIK